jgi:uncharacterized BrkB/YihY/UPF0761 family membrane protein
MAAEPLRETATSGGRSLRPTLDAVWRLVVSTVSSCLRYRVTGLAAEAAFFAVLSVPPLVFALAGAIGFVSDRFTDTQIEDVRNAVLEISRQALTEKAVTGIIRPTIDTVLDEYRRQSPLGRLTTVDEVGWAVAQLLAPEADALHGATLALDGGARRGLF